MKARLGSFKQRHLWDQKNQETNSLLWVELCLPLFHRHQVGATQGHMEAYQLLEQYMRCEGGNIQDEMPGGADLGNTISLYKMSLNTLQRRSEISTTPNVLLFTRETVLLKKASKQAGRWAGGQVDGWMDRWVGGWLSKTTSEPLNVCFTDRWWTLRLGLLDDSLLGGLKLAGRGKNQP